jgi:hypothetical protein
VRASTGRCRPPRRGCPAPPRSTPMRGASPSCSAVIPISPLSASSRPCARRASRAATRPSRSAFGGCARRRARSRAWRRRSTARGRWPRATGPRTRSPSPTATRRRCRPSPTCSSSPGASASSCTPSPTCTRSWTATSAPSPASEDAPGAAPTTARSPWCCGGRDSSPSTIPASSPSPRTTSFVPAACGASQTPRATLHTTPLSYDPTVLGH